MKEQWEYGANDGSPFLPTPHGSPAYVNWTPVDCEEYRQLQRGQNGQTT